MCPHITHCVSSYYYYSLSLCGACIQVFLSRQFCASLTHIPVYTGVYRCIPVYMCAHPSTIIRGVRACFTHALLLLYYCVHALLLRACFTHALLLLYSCFTRALSTLNFAYEEPENALSVPTWAIHFSSVFEWMFAMRLVWDYSEVCVHTLLVRLRMRVLLHY